MSFKIDHIQLKTKRLEVNALLFSPSKANTHFACAFTHGYTTHKGSILTWASKLMELNIPCLLFDLPGHILGGNKNLISFKAFEAETPDLFNEAKKVLPEHKHFLTGGHSLGALMSLIAGETRPPYAHFCVGLGLSDPTKKHLFQTELFRETLSLRGQLVSPLISPDLIFPWIATKKANLSLMNQKVHFLSGQDDIIIGKSEGQKRFIDLLPESNLITKELIKSLPHHQPERAGIYLKKYMKTLLDDF